MSRPQAVALYTHSYPEETIAAVRRVIDDVTAAGAEVRLSEEEADKHGLKAGNGVSVGSDVVDGVDIAMVLGGDGTILSALRTYTGTDVPVFSVNFGAIGFLATLDHGAIEDALRRVLSGDYETISMPALLVDVNDETHLAVNDVSFHRRPDDRVAELAYSVADEQLGRVRCDGLVASTPVGSTGYNLANGGPVLAWGVEGFVVSFIAPHTLTARALVVAVEDTLSVQNLSDRDPVDVTTDGRAVCTLGPRGEVNVSFRDDQVLLAQVPGTTFYRRLREKFGRLAY